MQCVAGDSDWGVEVRIEIIDSFPIHSLKTVLASSIMWY